MSRLPTISGRFDVPVPQVFLPQPSGAAAESLRQGLVAAERTASQLATFLKRSRENSQVAQGEIGLLGGYQDAKTRATQERDYANAPAALSEDLDSLWDRVSEQVTDPQARERLRLAHEKSRIALESWVADFSAKGQADQERELIGQYFFDALKAFSSETAVGRTVLIQSAEDKLADAVQSGAKGAEEAAINLREFKAAATMAAISNAMRNGTAQSAELELETGKDFLSESQIAAAERDIEALAEAQQAEMVTGAVDVARQNIRRLLSAPVRNWKEVDESITAMAQEIVSISPEKLDADDVEASLIQAEIELAIAGPNPDVEAFRELAEMVPNTVEAQTALEVAGTRLARKIASTLKRAEQHILINSVLSGQAPPNPESPEYRAAADATYQDRVMPALNGRYIATPEGGLAPSPVGQPLPGPAKSKMAADYAGTVGMLPDTMKNQLLSSVFNYNQADPKMQPDAEPAAIEALRTLSIVNQQNPGVLMRELSANEQAMVHSFQVAAPALGETGALRMVSNLYTNTPGGDLKLLRDEYKALGLNETIATEFGEIAGQELAVARMTQELAWLVYANGTRRPEAVVDTVRKLVERMVGEQDDVAVMFPISNFYGPSGQDPRWWKEQAAADVVAYYRNVAESTEDPIEKARALLVVAAAEETERQVVRELEASRISATPMAPAIPLALSPEANQRAVNLRIYQMLRTDFLLDLTATSQSYTQFTKHEGGTISFGPRYHTYLTINGIREGVIELDGDAKGTLSQFFPDFDSSYYGGLYREEIRKRDFPIKLAKAMDEFEKMGRLTRRRLEEPRDVGVAEWYLSVEQQRRIQDFDREAAEAAARGGQLGVIQPGGLPPELDIFGLTQPLPTGG